MIDDEKFSQDAIDRLTPIEPSAQLRRMVAQIPIEHAPGARSWWPFANIWLPSFSMAAVAALGLFLGNSWEESPSEGPAVASVPELSTLNGPRESEVKAPLATLAESEQDSLGAELEDFLLLATAGDFSAEDWDLSRDRDADAAEEEALQ